MLYNTTGRFSRIQWVKPLPSGTESRIADPLTGMKKPPHDEQPDQTVQSTRVQSRTYSRRLTATLLAAATRFLSVLPLSAARAIGGCLGTFVWAIDTRMARITRINLQYCCPDLDHTQLNAFSRQSLQETARIVAESGLVWHWPRERWQDCVVNVVGEADVIAARESGRGVLLLVPHFGNWEFLSLYLGKFDAVALYNPPRISALDAPIRNARSRAGMRLLPIDRGGLRTIYQMLGDGEVAAILPDQVPQRSAGVYAPFFGRSALTMTFVHRLIQRTNPVVFVAGARRVPGGFDITFSPVDEEIHSSDAVASARSMNRAIEQLVRTELAQYQWEYKRFRKEAVGAARVYPPSVSSRREG